MGFIGGAMMMKLPIAMREFRRRYPNVEIVPHAMHYPDHHPALRAGTIDIAWTVAEPDPEIDSVTVATDGLLAVVPADHPFATRDVIDVSDFTDEGLVTLRYADSPRLYDETMRLCAASGFRPSHVHEVLEEETVLGLVSAGFGVALVPGPWSVIHVPGIVFITISGNYFIREQLSWHRERHSPIIRAFVETTLEVLTNFPSPGRL
jgi:DNA-binding transcriptional LysR family regulator